MNITLEDIKFRSEYHNGDIGYLVWMHGRLYDFGIHFESYVAITLAEYYANLNPEKERFWIAEHQQKIIGHISLKETEGQAQLRYFLIDPQYRGLGIGHRLMTYFMEYMKEAGYKTSFLLTERNLKAAAHIYQKYGYRYVSHSYTDYGLEERRYEMQLE